MNALSVADLSNRARNWARIRRWRFLLRDCPLFTPQWYLDRNADVAEAGIDGLSHYLTRGWREGRNPGPEFDGAYYLARYPDVAALNIPPLLHYWVRGRKELRRPNASMDLEWIDAAAKRASEDDVGRSVTLDAPETTADGPLVSVIIPTYNRERMLPGVLDAWRELNRATQIPYEIVFSDDGSEDGTVALLESVHDLPIRVLRNKHGGASSARNAAIRDARGQRLLIIGDDIFPAPDLINVHWKLGQEHGPLVATLGVVDWHPELEVNHLMEHITEIGNEQFSYNRLPDGKFVDFRHFYTCNICVDRSMLERQETLFDHRFDQYGFEDIELGYRLSLQGLRLLFTRDAKGDHFHPYVIDGFCRRQISAGRMAVVFRGVHPGVGGIVGVDEPERALKKGLPTAEAERIWQSRLAELTKRAEMYEHMFERGGRAVRIVLGNCLSAIYIPLFRAMYEYGVLQRLAGTEAVLSIAMTRHFGAAWNPYWELLKGGRPDFSQMTREGLDQTVETLTVASDEIEDPVVVSAGHELSVLLAMHQRLDGNGTTGARWRRRISAGLYYLKHDPRQLPILIKGVVERSRTRASTQSSSVSSSAAQISLASSIALIVEPDHADQAAAIGRFISAFGADARIFERVDAVTLRELSEHHPSANATWSIDTVPCGVMYWPECSAEIPGPDALIDAWLAVVENGVDVAAISYGFGEPAQIRASGRRSHMLFSRRIAAAMLSGTLRHHAFRGKVIRIEEDPDRPAPAPQAVSTWLGVTVSVDPVGFFATDAAPDLTIRYLPPQFPKREKVRPVVFVFPIFVAVGGVERNTVEIVRQLSCRYDFVVITMERLRLEQGSLGRQFQEAGARLVQMSEFTNHADYLRVLSQLKPWLQPDVVWVCNGSPWLGDNASRLRLLFADVPIIDQQVYDVDQGWINRYNEPGFRSFDRFIAVNQKIFAKFVGDLRREPADVDLIYSAVDTERIVAYKRGVQARQDILRKYGLPGDKRLFAFIGRLTSQKRPVEFLRIAAARREHAEEFFVLVGDGELAPEVDAFLNRQKLTNVLRIPYVANTLELDSVLDGLIFTSAYEGLPIAMIEALSLAVPTLATDVGDIGVVLEEFDGGLVYPVNASKAEVLDAFERWAGQRARFRTSLLNKETALLERFSSRRIAQQYVDCFEKAMAGYRRVLQ